MAEGNPISGLLGGRNARDTRDLKGMALGDQALLDCFERCRPDINLSRGHGPAGSGIFAADINHPWTAVFVVAAQS